MLRHCAVQKKLFDVLINIVDAWIICQNNRRENAVSILSFLSGNLEAKNTIFILRITYNKSISKKQLIHAQI